jgi:hypothetical protein
MTNRTIPGSTAAVLAVAWLVAIAALFLQQGSTVGRYANTPSGEYAAQCVAYFGGEPEHPYAKACIDGSLDQMERLTVKWVAENSYREHALRLAAGAFGITAALAILAVAVNRITTST